MLKRSKPDTKKRAGASSRRTELGEQTYTRCFSAHGRKAHTDKGMKAHTGALQEDTGCGTHALGVTVLHLADNEQDLKERDLRNENQNPKRS